MRDELPARLRDGQPVVWTNPEPRGAAFDTAGAARELDSAEQRWARFAPALARLFETPDGSGRIFSSLLQYPRPIGGNDVLVKADHALPISACVKARGGVFGLLCMIENIAREEGLIDGAESYELLATARAREVFAKHTVTVASTGNLGFSIGLVAAAFGLRSEVHMSDCAQEWKKERLRGIGSTVVEYPGDYTSTVAAARRLASRRERTCFIDDENSWDLFVGYAGAGRELAGQIEERGIAVSVERPLVVYLPCGVGGAPGGITYGLRSVYGDAVVSVFAEPSESACMLLALACGGESPPSVYDVGLRNRTAADGLAVSKASPLVLEKMRTEIDAVVAVPDERLLAWVRQAWHEAEMKLEPSAAAAFASYEELQAAQEQIGLTKQSPRPALANIARGHHVAWTTGGDMMPVEVFEALLR
jgi:D-serine dehydratase